MALLRLWLLPFLLLMTEPLAAGGTDPQVESDPFGVELLSRLHWHDRDGLEDWELQTRNVLHQLRENGVDGDSALAIDAMLALLDAPRTPILHDQELDGLCRVRSLQANWHGAYQYPWFDCILHPEARAIVFHKPTGSQRRLGLIGRTESNRFVFVGALYFTDEQPGAYSSDHTHEPSADELSRDSVGTVFKLGTSHFLIGFVPRRGGHHELYEVTVRR